MRKKRKISFSSLTFFLVFIISFILFSIIFIRILSAFPDKPRVQGFFKSIRILDISILEAFVITGQQIFTPSVLTYRSDLNIINVSLPAYPGLRVSFTDPEFGTTITRISDKSMDPGSTLVRHEYNRFPGVNADGTKMILVVSGGRNYLLNPKTGTLWDNTSLAHAGPDGGPLASSTSADDLEFSWHPTDPNLAFYRQRNKVYKFHADTLTSETLCDFSSLYNWTTTKQEGRPSDDWQLWAFLGYTTPAGQPSYAWYTDPKPDVVVANLTNCQIIASRELQEVPDNVGISPLGNYVVVMGINASAQPAPGTDKTWLFDRNLNDLGYLHPCFAHSDFGFDSQGREVYVYDVSDDKCAEGWVPAKTPSVRGLGVIPLNVGKSSGYLALDFGWFQSIHPSGIVSRQHHGWFLASLSNEPWAPVCTAQYGCKPFFGEVVLVAINGSQDAVRRLAHHHTQMYFNETPITSVKQNSSGWWFFNISYGSANVYLPGFADGYVINGSNYSYGNARTWVVGSLASEWTFYSPPSLTPKVGDHFRITYRDYWGEPHATSSWDGNTLFFSSTWGLPFQREEEYMIEGNWWDNITNSYIYPPGDYNFSLMHDGLNRTYKVHVPLNYNGSSVPVVLALHGGGGNAEGLESSIFMKDTSDEKGFLLVYPEGVGSIILGKVFGVWNAGACCNSTVSNNTDDVGFISSMIDQLSADFSIDKKKVYATGISNGAQMSYRLACELSNKIAAIAPVAGQGVFYTCNPTRPVPVMHFHGTSDRCAHYNGGTCGGCTAEFYNKTFGINMDPDYFMCESVPSHIEYWRNMNNAPSTSTVIFQNNSAVCVSYGFNTLGEVNLCSIDGGGHTWPGGGYGGICINPLSNICKNYTEIAGNISYDINANEFMWEFFVRHELVYPSILPQQTQQGGGSGGGGIFPPENRSSNTTRDFIPKTSELNESEERGNVDSEIGEAEQPLKSLKNDQTRGIAISLVVLLILLGGIIWAVIHMARKKKRIELGYERLD